MVRFGERLEQLKQAGWEKHYIDYEKLKVMIDTIETTTYNIEAASDAFALSMEKEVKKVDGTQFTSTRDRNAAR